MPSYHEDDAGVVFVFQVPPTKTNNWHLNHHLEQLNNPDIKNADFEIELFIVMHMGCVDVVKVAHVWDFSPCIWQCDCRKSQSIATNNGTTDDCLV